MTNSQHERIKGAVFGQFVGDAAALGTHWIYDTTELLARHGGSIEGFESPSEGHYHHGRFPGEQTHYGDAAKILVESLLDSELRFDPDDFGKRFHSFFSSSSYSGYLDHATKDTLRNIDAFASENPNSRIPFAKLGSQDEQMASVTSLAPLLLVSSSLSETLQTADEFTRIRQNNARARAYTKTLVAILYHLVQGRPPLEAVELSLQQLDPANPYEAEAKQRAQTAVDKRDRSVLETTAELGQSCPLPGSFPSALHAFLRNENDFRDAILETIKAGGDNAGRAAIVGALCGANLGFDSISTNWIQKLAHRPSLSALLSRNAFV
ncbi:ADP-ribosylglycohydrolase family protein [Pelagicoccus sp. SDUM812003]|uniref:ADP-ribosylglycohydrolase family protein n=1 Tax=Pelagicoccus sp. SDUM812003 TaxID=3041267 RepID=UPI00280D1FFD|nr:ADP-ribosylglycohydrolase family protein [Pelagicoccus sp. SDUM812003]MDQ8205440.1 ADP-ribosylglycohydrolase family protein [Pelagicoccus sp. SDUM812003]